MFILTNDLDKNVKITLNILTKLALSKLINYESTHLIIKTTFRKILQIIRQNLIYCFDYLDKIAHDTILCNLMFIIHLCLDKTNTNDKRKARSLAWPNLSN